MPGDYNYYDPTDPNMGSQTDAGQRARGQQDVYQSLTAQVQALPAYQQWLRARGGNLSDADRKQAAFLLRSYGVSIPDGMEVDARGQVVPIDHTTRNRLLTAALAAPLFLPSGGAAAGGAAASTPGYAGVVTPGGFGVGSGATGASAAGATAGGATAGSYIRSAINDTARAASGGNSVAGWVDRLAPLIGLGTTAATGGFSSPQVGIDPTLQQQINELVGIQTGRAKASQPIYEAALRLAGQLAPTASTSPRLQAAIADAGMPVSSRQASMDPQVAEALTYLARGR